MATPNSVPLGQAGTGSAFVLPQQQAMAPLQMFAAISMQKQQREAVKAKQKADQLAAREKEAADWKLEYAEQDAAEFANAKSNFIQGSAGLYRQGKSLDYGSPEYVQLQKNKANITEDAMKSTQQKEVYLKGMQAPDTQFGKYTDVGSYKKNLHTWYVGEDGKRTFRSRNTADMPMESQPEFFRMSAFLDDKVKNIPMDENISTQIKNGKLGQLYVDTENSFRFTVRGKDGKPVPGIGQEHIDYFLKDNDYKNNVGYRVNKAMKEEAAALKASDPQYADMSEQQIVDKLAIEGDDVNERIHRLVKEDLEVYQQQKYSKKIRSGMQYDKPDKGNQDDNKKLLAAIERLRHTNLVLEGDPSALNSLTNSNWNGGTVMEAKAAPKTNFRDVESGNPGAMNLGQLYQPGRPGMIELTVDYGEISEKVPVMVTNPKNPNGPLIPDRGGAMTTVVRRDIRKEYVDPKDRTVRSKISAAMNTENYNVEPEWFRKAEEEEARTGVTPSVSTSFTAPASPVKATTPKNTPAPAKVGMFNRSNIIKRR